MEVIYYMRNYYPLTAAQKMHHNWILDYGTQQVSGVSVVASVQAELDFGLLKKCIQMETERSGCTRIRFTKPCLLYTSPSPRDGLLSRMPSSA